MEKIKINDYYEFPVELDMSKYITEDSKEANLNQYSLKSVVVHKGNSDGGHYYAFIKTNNDQWYNFNDTQVTPFDIDFLREEAYGGEEIYNENGNKEVKKKIEMLIYYFMKKKTNLIVNNLIKLKLLILISEKIKNTIIIL
jgi:ubiquitin carboxyl-terminal hydrolase 7